MRTQSNYVKDSPIGTLHAQNLSQQNDVVDEVLSASCGHGTSGNRKWPFRIQTALHLPRLPQPPTLRLAVFKKGTDHSRTETYDFEAETYHCQLSMHRLLGPFSMHRLLGPSTIGHRQRSSNDGDRRERHLALCPHKKNVGDEAWAWPWVGECGLAWRGGGLGTGVHGLGGRPRVEAGEGRGGSRARTTSGQASVC